MLRVTCRTEKATNITRGEKKSLGGIETGGRGKEMKTELREYIGWPASIRGQE